MIPMIDSIIEWDRNAMVALNMGSNHSVFLDTFFWMISDILVWMPVLATFFYVVAKNKKKEVFYVLLSVIVMFALCDQISSSLLKPSIARLRPSRDPFVMDLLSYVHEYRGGQFGFPSSHAANSFGFMILSSLILKNRLYTVVAAIWALLCSYSRIYLGVHFPLDICCGMVLGLFLGSLSYYGLRMALKRYPVHLTTLPEGRVTESGYAVRDIYQIVVILSIVLFSILCCAIRA